MLQAGSDPDQVRFRDILLRLRDAQVTPDDWEALMKQTPTKVLDLTPFASALHLYPTVEAVVEHNVTKLKDSGQPIAPIKAVHTGANAAKASPDNASGLEAVVCLAKSARVMLTSNLWVEVGLVNGAMGTIQAICYRSGGPPDLPLVVMVKFDHYSGPTLHDGTVPITPLRRTWSNAGVQCSRL
jgi:ATP-dependent DNA helicase PIF1